MEWDGNVRNIYLHTLLPNKYLFFHPILEIYMYYDETFAQGPQSDAQSYERSAMYPSLLYDFMMDFWFLIFIPRCFFSLLLRVQFFHLTQQNVHNARVHLIFFLLHSERFFCVDPWFCLPGWRTQTETNVQNSTAKNYSVLEYLIWLEVKKNRKKKFNVMSMETTNLSHLAVSFNPANDLLLFGQFVFFLNHDNKNFR